MYRVTSLEWGIALKRDRPYDQEGERKNPWWGDPSFRVILNTVITEDIDIYHLHINPEFGREDINSLHPVDRLKELVEMGTVGRAAPSHYSTMGYILDSRELLSTTVPAIVERLNREEVDV